jgi:hypothetical protein
MKRKREAESANERYADAELKAELPREGTRFHKKKLSLFVLRRSRRMRQ